MGLVYMTISEIERFTADMKTNEVLRLAAEKALAEASHETPLACAVTFAARKGYAFTVDEVKKHVTGKSKGLGKALTDAELDNVLVGSCLVFFLSGGTCLPCYSVFSNCLLAVPRAGFPTSLATSNRSHNFSIRDTRN